MIKTILYTLLLACCFLYFVVIYSNEKIADICSDNLLSCLSKVDANAGFIKKTTTGFLCVFKNVSCSVKNSYKLFD